MDTAEQSNKMKKALKPLQNKDFRACGGEGETRTLAPVTRPTPLAGAPRHQLEYFSIGNNSRCYLIL